MADRIQTDVAIIGGGGAGIPAAIEVARAGGQCVVLEQAKECGGTAAISGGGCCIVGTPLQKAQGITDTPDLAFEDWVKWAAVRPTKYGRAIISNILCTISTTGRRVAVSNGSI